MAEGGEPREFEEVDFSGDPDDDLMRPLSSNEEWPMSPQTPRGSVVFPPFGLASDLEERVRTLEEHLSTLLGTVAGVIQQTEDNKQQQNDLRLKFEQLRKEPMEMAVKYTQLMEMVKEVQINQENVKEKVEQQVAEMVQRRVNEELDKRMAKLREEMKELMVRYNRRDAKSASESEEEVEVVMKEKKSSCPPGVIDERVKEMESALRVACRKREEVRKKFEVTVVRLKQVENQNESLLERVKELEQRCLQLEEENRRLRTREIVQQTHFSLQGPSLECFSCKQEYTTDNNPPESCMFHPLPQMPYESWRCYISQEELPPNFLQGGRRYFYWACCNVLATRRPAGCCRGQHHQQWEMDIVMRQVLTDGDRDVFSETLSII
ncbi:uncharacterized protein [Diadema antillarum]|uniref:uncharacterized protein n=1 Tax=Diadema antillarum TaxID=105358 RepID=UPI003A888ACE